MPQAYSCARAPQSIRRPQRASCTSIALSQTRGGPALIAGPPLRLNVRQDLAALLAATLLSALAGLLLLLTGALSATALLTATLLTTLPGLLLLLTGTGILLVGVLVGVG